MNEKPQDEITRPLDKIVKCFNFPFVFFSWVTGIEIKPEDTGKVERLLLFIAFILLCFGFYRLLSHLMLLWR